MQIIRRHRVLVWGLLGLTLLSGSQTLHAQTEEGSISVYEAAVCYVRMLSDTLTSPITAGGKYGQCLEAAAAD